MIADFLKRDVVLAHLEMLRGELQKELADTSTGKPPDPTTAALLSDLDGAQAREEEASSGQKGFDLDDRRTGAAAPSMDEQVFLSRDPVVSLVQSALDEWAIERAEVITE